jgi:hypothetical protein
VPTGGGKAQFKHNSKMTTLGQFTTEEGAARAYDRMLVWFKVRGVERRGGIQLNFDYAEYKGELEELGRMTQAEVVAKLRQQAQAQRGSANDAQGDEAGEGAEELGGAGGADGGGEGEGEGEDEGNGLFLDRAPTPHPNFLRWWRLGLTG